jgi:hypothetical protein
VPLTINLALGVPYSTRGLTRSQENPRRVKQNEIKALTKCRYLDDMTGTFLIEEDCEYKVACNRLFVGAVYKKRKQSGKL